MPPCPGPSPAAPSGRDPYDNYLFMNTNSPNPDPQHDAGTPAGTPRVWVIRSYRAGENSQVTALAEALGWAFDEKRLHYRGAGFIPNLSRAVSLAGIDPGRSDSLAPPWPDIVISSGLRNEPVCRWIKQASGGRTRLVQIGRTWASPPPSTGCRNTRTSFRTTSRSTMSRLPAWTRRGRNGARPSNTSSHPM